MKQVLDATAFFLEVPLEGELYTTPRVVAELMDVRSRCRLEALLAQGLGIREPGMEACRTIEEAAARSGDAAVLSAADRELLALALELPACVVTDDFAVQNVARHLGLAVRPLQQRRAKMRRWKFRCTGCGRYSGGEGECPVCGAPLKRTIK